MCLCLPYFGLTWEIPHFQHAVSTAAGEAVEGVGVFGESVDTIHVTPSELGDKGGGEDAVEFGGVEGAGVLARAFEGMQRGIEVARLAGDIAAGRLLGARRAGEGFDLLESVLVIVTSLI